ncbi:MAG: peptidylprolyl isomerase [Burkholderiaceae bacterium]|nr:peptidylprolyl isomerase [Burkholderiaceae bacterium]
MITSTVKTLHRSILCAALICTSAMADEAAMFSNDGLSITATDINAEVQRVPPAARKESLSKPENVTQIASNLYVRRALAAEAVQQGLAADPLVAAALKIAQDKVLSDAILTKIDLANTPSDQALEQFTLARYRTETQRFQKPEEIHARHILLKKGSAEAQAQAVKILTELKAGANFEELAKQYSQDPGSAVKGGDLGFFRRGQMVPEFDTALATLLKPGELSGVIETEFGLHIIRLEERKEARTANYEEVRTTLKQETLAKLLNEGRAREAQRLLGAAKYDPHAAAAYAASQQR